MLLYLSKRHSLSVNTRNQSDRGRCALLDEQCEKSFSDFLENDAYDQAEEAIFQMIGKAFLAGWVAAKREKMQLKE